MTNTNILRACGKPLWNITFWGSRKGRGWYYESISDTAKSTCDGGGMASGTGKSMLDCDRGRLHMLMLMITALMGDIGAPVVWSTLC